MNLKKIWKSHLITRLTLSVIIIFVSVLIFTEAEDSLNQPLIFEENPTQKEETPNYQKYIDSINQTSYYTQTGTASYYGKRFHNRKTASGLRYDMTKFTAAHRTINFGNILRITNQKTGFSTLVLINDRGPFIKKRILDLSKASAKQINGLGIPKVQLETLNLPDSLPEFISNRLYLAFSIDCEPKFIDQSQVVLLRGSNDFSEIVELIHQAKDNSQINEFCLIVKASNYGTLSSDNVYWLGTIQPNNFLVREQH